MELTEELKEGLKAGEVGAAEEAQAAAAEKKFTKDLTKGSVLKQLILFSLPFLLSNLIQAFYNVGDTLVVGWMNGTASALTAVNTGGQVTLFVTNMVVGFCLGGTVLISQFLGAKKHLDIKESIGTLFTMLIIVSIFLSVVMIAAAKPILRLLGTSESAMNETFAYVAICMAGNIFIFGYNGISAVLRGMGDTVRPMIIVGCTCVLNIGLDILFIGPFGMGVAGAALATILAQGIALVTAVVYLYKKKFVFDFKFKSFKIYKEKLKKLIKIGLPTCLLNCVNSISFLILLALVNAYGRGMNMGEGMVDIVNAGAGLAGKVNSISILPSFAIGMSVAAMAAQNIGAGLHKRAVKTMFIGMAIATALGCVFYVLAQLFSESIIKLFFMPGDADNLNKAEVIKYGAIYLKAFSFDYIAVGLFIGVSGLLNGSGHTLVSMIASMCSSIIIRIPLAYIFDNVLGWGLRGIGLAVPCATLVTTILGAAYIMTGRWKVNKLGINAPVLEM